MTDPSDVTVSSAFRLYERMATMVAKHRDDTGQVPAEVVSQLFACADLVLTAYYHPSNWIDEKTPKEAIPPQLARTIAIQIRYIRAGNLPDPIADLVRPGTPGSGPHAPRIPVRRSHRPKRTRPTARHTTVPPAQTGERRDPVGSERRPIATTTADLSSAPPRARPAAPSRERKFHCET